MIDFGTVLRSLDEKIGGAQRAADECVQEMVDCADEDLQYLIAERLPRLGSLVLPSLRQLLANPETTGTLGYLVSVVALEVGDRERSVEILRREVTTDSKWALPAANALARHKVVEAQSEIRDALDRQSFDRDNPATADYSHALKRVEGTISAATRARIVDQNPSWIARAVREDFPEESKTD